jgi:PST family polysaccharide transporter
VTRSDDAQARTIVAIAALTLPFTALDTIDLYFQSQVTTKYTVWARNAAFLAFAVAKVGMIVGRAGVVWFAWAQAGEIALGAVLLSAFYRKGGHSMRAWRPSRARMRRLLAECWPLILTSLAVVVYMRIDQVMLKEMAGEREVGIYSAALRLSEVWYFVPTAIVASVFPSIVRVRETNRELYYQRILRLFSLMAAFAVCLSAPVALASHWLIGMMFGAKYAAAAPVLAVHIWASLFVAWGVAQEPWNVAEGLLRLTLVRTVIGAAVNVGLNLVLIPRYGSLGAAWATLVAYGFAAVLGNLLSARTRPMFLLQVRSLAFPWYLLRRA